VFELLPLTFVDRFAPEPFQSVELDVRQGVNVGVSQLNCPRQDAMVFKQPAMTGDRQHPVDRQVVFGEDPRA